MKKINLFLLSFLVFFILSCSNMFEPQQASGNKQGASYLTVSGTLSAEFDSSAVPRSAFPANSINLASYTTNIYYKTSADAQNRTLCGTSTGSSTFEFKLPSFGNFFLEAESYLTSDATKTIKLKTLTSTQITLNEAVSYKNDVSLFLSLKVDNDSNAKGSVKLPIQSFNATSVRTLKIYKENAPESCVAQLQFGDQNGVTNPIEWENDIDPGVDTYIFKFYSLYDILVYQCVEKVTIFPDMETNTWVNNGNAEYFAQVTVGTETKTVMKITQDCLDNFALTNFYVSESGNDDNSGSYFAPLQTIEKALEKCTNGSLNYTINLDGTFLQSEELIISNKIKIQKAADALTAVIKRQDASHTNSMISVASLAVCTISGVTIDGSGFAVAVNGAGIYNGGTLTLKNCILQNCVTNQVGGAIYNYGGTITIDGGVIGDSTKNEYPDANNNKYSNYAKNGGAGVFVADGIVTIKGDCTITYNHSNANGGGIFTAASGKVVIKDNARISWCDADNGGGVYIMGYVELKDNAVISNCVAKGKGGGVGIGNYGTLTMSGGTISDCNAGTKGGGVFIDTNATLSMSGGNIDDRCSCDTYDDSGFGVYVDGTFEMSADASVSGWGAVYLSGSTTVKITGTLNNGSGASISVYDYNSSPVVLSGAGNLVAENYQKFSMGVSQYYINSSGAIYFE